MAELTYNSPIYEEGAKEGCCELVGKLFEDSEYCRKKFLHPLDFWTYYMGQKPAYFYEPFLKLLKINLSIPTGSADAERAFSHYNLIKTKLRNGISSPELNSLMRTKLNTVKNMKDFPAAELAKKWVLHGHSRSDSPFRLPNADREDLSEEEENDCDDYDEFQFMEPEIL